MRTLTLLLAAGALCLGCQSDRDDRRHVFARAGEVDRAIAGGPVVRDLRSRTDSGSILYSSPTNLARDTVLAAGAQADTAARRRDGALHPRPTAGRRASVTAR